MVHALKNDLAFTVTEMEERDPTRRDRNTCIPTQLHFKSTVPPIANLFHGQFDGPSISGVTASIEIAGGRRFAPLDNNAITSFDCRHDGTRFAWHTGQDSILR